MYKLIAIDLDGTLLDTYRSNLRYKQASHKASFR